MILPRLTQPAPPAKTPAMQGNRLMRQRLGQMSGRRAVRARVMLIGAALALSGCVSVSAPDKPIVIELNINIKQEVVYKLDKGVSDLIDKNSEIF